MPEIPSHKVCTACNQKKPFSEFYKHTAAKYGLHPECKACIRMRIRRYRHTEAGKAYRKREAKKYARTEHGRLANLRKVQKHTAKHPEQRRARNAINNRVNSGTMQRPNICSKCGAAAKRIEADHYKGYAPEHRLEVQWLCVACHKERHRQDAK